MVLHLSIISPERLTRINILFYTYGAARTSEGTDGRYITYTLCTSTIYIT